MTLTLGAPNPTVRIATAAESRPPQVWLMLGKLAGDNAQVLALSRALGWPYAIKRIEGARKSWPFASDSPPRPAAGEEPLTGPWPDLVIGIGGLGSRAGNWVKRQSGGRTRHVQLGKIDGGYDRFDLIVTTPQYELPVAAHVLHLTLPIVRPNRDAPSAAGRQWAPHWSALPKPWIGVLVGGPSWPISFSRADGKRLADQIAAVAAGSGGSLLIAAGPAHARWGG